VLPDAIFGRADQGVGKLTCRGASVLESAAADAAHSSSAACTERSSCSLTCGLAMAPCCASSALYAYTSQFGHHNPANIAISQPPVWFALAVVSHASHCVLRALHSDGHSTETCCILHAASAQGSPAVSSHLQHPLRRTVARSHQRARHHPRPCCARPCCATRGVAAGEGDGIVFVHSLSSRKRVRRVAVAVMRMPATFHIIRRRHRTRRRVARSARRESRGVDG
jgi:hypothetical protein